nr:60S ribosomal protein L10a [Oryctolagus cuniculus]
MRLVHPTYQNPASHQQAVKCGRPPLSPLMLSSTRDVVLHVASLRQDRTANWKSVAIEVIGQQHCHKAKAADIPHVDTEVLKKLTRNKKLAETYGAFLASESLIKQTPRILGPAGKFRFLLTHKEDMVAKVDEAKSTIQFQMRKTLCLAMAVGHVKMTDNELVYNIHLAVNFLVSLLKKNRQGLAP